MFIVLCLSNYLYTVTHVTIINDLLTYLLTIVLGLGVYFFFFVLLVPYVCYLILVKFR